jgi:undecaprenyl-diphosphatase
LSLTLLLEPDFLKLALLAVVQGLTEFLPVSSSGHLVLSQAALGLDEPAIAIDVALHLGTLVAVLAIYRGAVLQVLGGLFSGDRREAAQIIVASIPAAVVGLTLLEGFREAFHDPRMAGFGLLATAAILLFGERARRRQPAPGPVDSSGAEEQPPLAWKHALLIGLAQGLAVWPGISRSGSTIAVGLWCGLPPARAARFSFLLSIPAIGGAAILHLPDAFETNGTGGMGGLPLLAAMVLAAIVGCFALRLLLSFLGKGAFGWFAIYCAFLGLAALFL